jgi:hypothetical protein
MTRNTSDEPFAPGPSRVPAPAGQQPPDLDALGRQALLTFWRDLPQLLQERPGQWVAYRGERQLGFGRTRTELWQECLRQGLDPEEFMIRSIQPEDPDLVLDPPESP